MNSRNLLIKTVENWPVKVLCIASALILVVFRQMSTLESRPFLVPLAIEGDETLTPSASFVQTIRVTLRGDRAGIDSIANTDIDAFIDLSKYSEPGSYHIPVQVRKEGSALGVDPLEISIDPLEVTLELDVKVSKTVPLRPNFRGSVAEGYELTAYTLSPAQVSIDGPRNVVGGISELITEVIDLAERQENFSLTTAVVNRDPLVNIRGRGTVEFRGTVREQLGGRVFERVPFSALNLDERFSVEFEPETGTVRLQGGRLSLDNFTLPADFLSLDCSEIQGPGTYTLPVAVSAAAPFSLAISEPAEAVVRVSARLAETP